MSEEATVSDEGITSSSASNRIFFKANNSPVFLSFALYTTPFTAREYAYI
jgi:hypothetical protein